MIRVYEPLKDEQPSIYEMGIPVVETHDKFHIDVQQKVPLNLDRDNVRPAYLQLLRTMVLNHTFHLLKKEEITEDWVQAATSDKRCDPQATQHIITERFGEKVVAFDPSDTEANKIAFGKGYQVLGGRTLSKGQWDNVKRIKQILPAGQVTPSPKPFSIFGRGLKLLDKTKYTPAIHIFIDYAKLIALELLNSPISIIIANDSQWNYSGAFGSDHILTVNLSKVHQSFFEDINTSDGLNKINQFLLHEFAHGTVQDHLSYEYNDRLCELGAKLTQLALEKPEIFLKENVNF
jgi:hypothetical protein